MLSLWGMHILSVSFWTPGTYCPHCWWGNCQKGRESQQVVFEAQGRAGWGTGQLLEGKGDHRWEGKGGPLMGAGMGGDWLPGGGGIVSTWRWWWILPKGFLLGPYLPERHNPMGESKLWWKSQSPLRLVVTDNRYLPTRLSWAISLPKPCHVSCPKIKHLQGSENWNRYNSAQTFGSVNKME